jgi:hypothetical protein
MTGLRSLGTNHLRPGRMYLTHRTKTETPWPACRYRGHLDITAYPLFDFTCPFDLFRVGRSRARGFTVFFNSLLRNGNGGIPTAYLTYCTVHFSILTILGVITNSPFVRMGLRRTCIFNRTLSLRSLVAGERIFGAGSCVL